jgi:predicted GIY-YIG superfamily endonuclease
MVNIMSLLRLALESNNDHYSVYVVELSKDVLHEPKFMKHNPQRITNKCVYVGYTGLDPRTRFQKHKDGIKHNTYVQKYGIRLLPELYEKYNPMSNDDAKAKEVELANTLRSLGYGVYQA